jgi:hypothetical protein
MTMFSSAVDIEASGPTFHILRKRYACGKRSDLSQLFVTYTTMLERNNST